MALSIYLPLFGLTLLPVLLGQSHRERQYYRRSLHFAPVALLIPRYVGGRATYINTGARRNPAARFDLQKRRTRILVNNAGGSGEKHVWEETPVGAWIAAFDRNVVAAVRLTNLLLPKMRAAGWGRIVNVSSLAGTLPPATGQDYSACKAAMNNLTKSLSKAAAGDGITVNAISSGTILTPKLEASFRMVASEKGWAAVDAPWAEIERAVLPKMFEVPAGTVGRPEDIGRAVAFLCSPLAVYITGVDLHIDGGAMPAL